MDLFKLERVRVDSLSIGDYFTHNGNYVEQVVEIGDRYKAIRVDGDPDLYSLVPRSFFVWKVPPIRKVIQLSLF